MKAYCIKDYQGFKKNNYYISHIISVFETNDFISIEFNKELYRFKLKEITGYIEDYIGENEIYFYDYFVNITEDRKNKLKVLSKNDDM